MAERISQLPRPSTARRLVVLGAISAGTALLAGTAAWAYVSTHHPARPGDLGYNPAVKPTTLRSGRYAPQFKLARLGGGPLVTSAGLRGHPAVLNFFASWCTDCRQELSAFARASKSAAGQVEFVGIDTNDPKPASALALLRKAGDTYPVGIAPSTTLASAYRLAGVPVTVYLSATGRVVGEVYGAQTTKELDTWVDHLSTGRSPAGSS